jgi:hypothetical protein
LSGHLASGNRLRLGLTAPALLLAAAAAAAAGGLAGAGPTAAGRAVDGRDAARVLAPPGARVSDYQGAGYRLTVRGGEALVEVDASPLCSAAAFTPPGRAGDALARLARAQVSGAATRYEAISRILGWVARHVDYRLDRGEPQTAAAVLARRSGYCTGIARLTVALLGAAGIEAREVAGYVADDGSGDGVRGYHRWIEAYLPDRGWVMSDPLASHHYVPATYVRLAAGDLRPESGLEGVLLERDDRVAIVDFAPGAGPGVTVRRNARRRLAAALEVRLEGAAAGQAVLVGPATVYRHALVDGGFTFVGLEPGNYQLRLELPGGAVLERPVELPDRERAGLRLRPASRQAPPPRATTPMRR